MKMKKSILSVALVSAGLFISGLIVSCGKDNSDTCKQTCQNGGTCVNGSCSCPAGYEGTSCEIKSLTKFTGSWKVTENLSLNGSDSVLDNSGYLVNISPANNTTVTDLLVDNIADAGNVVRLNGKVTNNTLSIATDTIQGKIYAVPTITKTNDSTLNIRFSVTDAATGTLEKDRTATLTK